MTTAPRIAFGANPAALRRFDAVATFAFWIAIFLGVSYLFFKLYPLTQPGATAAAMKNDFAVFWAAGKLAAAGQPFAAFDAELLLLAAEQSPETIPNNFVWFYPASFQVLLIPFGAVPYTVAYPAFVALSWIALILAVRAPAQIIPGLWRMLFAAPAVLVGCLIIGQTSVLWTAGLIAGLWAIYRGKPAAAGLAFALLTLKPQLGVLIPIALIAGREWKVIGWGGLFTAMIIGLSTAIVGAEYWNLFFAALGEATQRVSSGAMDLNMMPSPYGFMRGLGLVHDAALVPQMFITVITAAIVAWVWSRSRLGQDLKSATLSAAILLVMPYAFYYEATLGLAAALFLIRDGFGQGVGGKLWLLVLWFGTVPPLVFPTVLPISIYMPPVIAVTLLICLLRVHHRLLADDGGAAATRAKI